MKFVCDSCNTKYSIADERVHGRVLKIRCKTCDHVITVREEAHHEPSFDDQSDHTMVSGMPGGEPPTDDWHVSFDGDQEGPLSIERAIERVRAESARGREAHAWKPGFFVWLPVEEVPEFARALVAVRPAPPPVAPPAPAPPPIPRAAAKAPSGPQPSLRSPTGAQPVVQSATGAQPAVRSPTGPQPALRSPTGPQPALRNPTGPQPALRSPTGPQPAAKVPESAPVQSLPPVDSKPIPLPPPPELLTQTPLSLPLPLIPTPMPGDAPLDAPATPMTGQLTKPEPRISRRALEAEALAELPLPPTANAPAPKVLPSLAAAAAVSPAAPLLAPTPALRTPPPGAPAPLLSPTAAPAAAAKTPAAAAARAAAASAAPTARSSASDTGPTPLPPPPGADDDLIIGDASGLLNLSHLSGPTGLPRAESSNAPLIDTFGGVAITPAPPNGAAAPAPVVVVAGPRTGAAPWLKLAVVLLLLVTLGLGVALFHSLNRPATPPLADVGSSTGRRVDDTPITVTDPAPPTSIGPAIDVKKPPAAPAPAAKRPSTPRPNAKPGTGLSNEQKSLASLYTDEGDKTTPHEVPAAAAAHPQAQVSQTSILGVVTQNRRSLNLCYDRVLKHDTTLKRARLVTRVKVGLSGNVTSATVEDPEYANSEIGQCITQTIRRWHFPAADSEYETEFPILLQAD